MTTPVTTPAQNDVTAEPTNVEVKTEAGVATPVTAVGLTGIAVSVEQAQVAETQREWAKHVEVMRHPVKTPPDEKSGAYPDPAHPPV